MRLHPWTIAIGFLLLIGISASAYPPEGPMNDGANAWVWGDMQTARQKFTEATHDSKTRVNATYNLGYLHLWEGQLDSAKALMTRALEIDSNFAPAHFELGKMALEEGKVVAAEDHLQQATSIPTAAFRVWQILGEAKLALGDTAGAMDAFAKALDLHPDYHASLESLAQISLARADTAGALTLLSKACHVAPAPAAYEKYLAVLKLTGKTALADSVAKVYLFWYPEQNRYSIESTHTMNPLFPVGEQTRFSVGWEFIKLGSAALSITGWESFNGYNLLRLHIKVESSPLVMVINVDDIYDALIDPLTGICHQFYFHMNSTGIDLIGCWNYYYDDQEYISRTVVGDGYIYGIRKRLPARVTDGPSLIYHFRYMVNSGSPGHVIFVLEDEYQSGDLYPSTEKKKYKVGDTRLNTFKYIGNLSGRGIVGLSGTFSAWFSKVPGPLLVRAEAKIFLGSARIWLADYSP
jgi:tetratricopeptide (TPR) repeat protein